MHTRSVSLGAKARAAVAVGLAVLGSAAQSALAQDNVTIDAQKCQKLESPAERLECYERQVNAASAQRQASPTPQTAAPAAPAAHSAVPATAAATATAAVSAPPNTAPAAAPGPAKPSSTSGNTSEPQEIVGKISALSTTVPNAWLITLDNGQVWRQTYPDLYPLHAGQRVTLRPSKWGAAFRLTADGSHGFIQVERVR